MKRRFTQSRVRVVDKNGPSAVVLSSIRSRSGAILFVCVLLLLLVVPSPRVPYKIGSFGSAPSLTSQSTTTSSSTFGIGHVPSTTLLSDPSVLLTRRLVDADLFPVADSILTDKLSPEALRVSSREAGQRATWVKQLQVQQQQPHLCEYAAVLQSDLIEPPPSLSSHFVPQLLNLSSSWCVFICVSSDATLAAWKSSDAHTVAPPNRLFVYTPVELRALDFRSSEHLSADQRRVTTASQNVLYLAALARGARAIFDATVHMQLRDGARLSSLAYNLTHGTQTATLLNSSCPSSSRQRTFANPWAALRPMRLSDQSETHTRVWPRGMPAPDVHSKCGHDLLYNKRFDWDLVPDVYRSSVSVVATAVDGIPDVDAGLRVSGGVPLSFMQQLYVVSTAAPFGKMGVMWGADAFASLFIPPSGTLANRASDIVRSLVAQRLLANPAGFGAVVVANELHRDFFNYLSSDSDVDDGHDHGDHDEGGIDLALALSTPRIARFLAYQWNPPSQTEGLSFGAAVVAAWDALREHSVVITADVEAAVDWALDVAATTKCNALETDNGGICSKWSGSAGNGGNNNAKARGHLNKYKVAVEDSEEAQIGYLGRQRRQPNVAVCVSGQLRSLNLRPGDKDHQGWHQVRSSLAEPNESVANSIQRVLYPRLGNPDVFMTVSTRGGKHEPTVGDIKACEPLKAPGGSLKCIVRLEEPIPVYLNDTLWAAFAQIKLQTQARERVVQGMLQQLKGMYECYKMIANHEGSIGKRYDWIVRLRPDMYFDSFPSLATLAADMPGNTVWYANRDTCCCGNEDTFGIGPAHLMSRYLQRFVHLQMRDWWFVQQGVTWSGESFTQFYLEEVGARLEPHPEIKSCIVKPRRRVFSSEP